MFRDYFLFFFTLSKARSDQHSYQPPENTLCPSIYSLRLLGLVWQDSQHGLVLQLSPISWELRTQAPGQQEAA